MLCVRSEGRGSGILGRASMLREVLFLLLAVHLGPLWRDFTSNWIAVVVASCLVVLEALDG